jgi:DNA-binding IclR family transcriptional regulator
MGEAKHPVKTTDQTLRIVDLLLEMGSAGVTEIANACEMSKSGVHNHLKTLEDHGYVVGDDGVYSLGLRFLDVGGKVRDEMELYRVAKPEVESLADETGESVILATEQNGYCIHLDRANGDEAVNPVFINTHTGLRETMHNSALGKAILAHLPPEHVETILDKQGLPRTSPQTITDRETLLDQLETIRERGYSVDNEERIEGLRAIAAPIMTDDTVVGSICVCGPTRRLSDERFEEELSDTILNTTNIVELGLSH